MQRCSLPKAKAACNNIRLKLSTVREKQSNMRVDLKYTNEYTFFTKN